MAEITIRIKAKTADSEKVNETMWEMLVASEKSQSHHLRNPSETGRDFSI